MTTIALISDQHFDVSSRWEETLRIAKWIADDLARRGVDLILLGGDLFERRPVPDETRAAAEWIVALADTAPVVGVQGNHDVENAVAVMNLLEARHRVTMYERPGVLAAGGCAIACLPWPSKANVLATLPDASKEAGEQVAAGALQNVLRGLGQQLDEGDLTSLTPYDGPRLLLAHAMVRGSRTSVGQPLMGCDFELGLEDLALVRAHAYLLGHIHCPQDWTINGAPVIYPGSPRRTAYGEIEEKGYVLLRFEGPTLVSWERVPTPATPMILLEMDAERDGDRIIFVSRGDYQPDLSGADVRFRYHVPSDMRDGAKLAARGLEADLLAAGAVIVKVEEEVEPQTRARAPEIAAALTLAEKIDRFWERQGFDPGDRREALHSKLRELEAEDRA